MKEILDRLDERVTSLLKEVDALHRENEDLRREMAEQVAPLASENQALRDALAREKASREAAASRIDALLERLTTRVQQ
jgi:regulator of replication initiation timing